MTLFVNESTFRQIAQNGQYYFPAKNHYQNETVVCCDRCQRSSLPACIGWLKYDLCLECAQIIINQLNQLTVERTIPRFAQTRMQRSSAFPGRGQMVTNMQVSSAFPSQKSPPVTFMHVSSALPNQRSSALSSVREALDRSGRNQSPPKLSQSDSDDDSEPSFMECGFASPW